MDTVNIYSDKRNSKLFVTSIVILLIVSIFMVIFGSKLRTNEAVIQAALIIFIVVMINIIKDITDARNYKASLKIKKYVNLKKEIISYAGLATIAVLAIILVPFSITLQRYFYIYTSRK